MRTGILIWLSCAFFSHVIAIENEVKRGVSPFMAFVYYPDETVVDETGARFLRGAVLISQDWLVTSAVGPSILENAPNGFPQKTMLARLGAIAIDSNFTLNEDEDEQEREIIQIVRPYNNSATQWWRTDISLMKTLLPFNITTAVATTSLNFKADYADKTCSILVYAKRFESVTEDKVLMQLSVDMLVPSMENCGSHFDGSTMTCAVDSDENKNIAKNSEFCRGNSGGPLLCDGQVIGLQTYIENKCKQPHLYQLVSAWETFIQCGTKDSCNKEICVNTCEIVNKDVPVSELPKIGNDSFVSSQPVDSTVITSQKPVEVTSRAPVEVTTRAPAEVTTQTPAEVTTRAPTEATSQTPAEVTEGEIRRFPTMSTLVLNQMVLATNESSISTNTIIKTSETTLYTEVIDNTHASSTSWPNQKHKEHRTMLTEETVGIERKANLEAQYQQANDEKIKVRSAANRNLCSIEILIEIFVLACLF